VLELIERRLLFLDIAFEMIIGRKGMCGGYVDVCSGGGDVALKLLMGMVDVLWGRVCVVGGISFGGSCADRISVVVSGLDGEGTGFFSLGFSVSWMFGGGG